jgi:hypothetical protein
MAANGRRSMRDKPVIVHFCNTCAHVMKTTKEEPCKSCRPEIFGGPDRWEPRNGKDTKSDS